MNVKSAVALLGGLVAFVMAILAARWYRQRTGIWVPGWIGGISLLALFGVAFVVAIVLGAPEWFEVAFFVMVGLHVGTFVALSAVTK